MEKIIGILEKLGVQVETKSGFTVRFSTRFKTTLGVAAAAGLLAFMSVVHYTQTPGFCRSCHIMEPYYQAWNGSKHNKVSCVKCHYPPASAGLKALLWRKFQSSSEVAKYVTRTYASKPYADVTDAACLQCHPDRLLDGWVKVGDKGVRFDHRPHLTEKRRDRQLRCTSCHSQIMVGGNIVGGHMVVTYDTCYTCHFKGMGTGKNLKPVGGCLSCHNLPEKSFKLNGMTYNHKDYAGRKGVSCMDCHLGVVRGEGAALKDRCFTCHNQPEKLAKYTDVPFLHENHVTKHHVACFHCHQKIKHGFGAGEGDPTEDAVEHAATPSNHPTRQGLECSNCHQEKHGAQLQLYSASLPEGMGAAAPEMANPMYTARVSCSGCHYSDKTANGGFSGITQKAAPDACEKCHGAKFKGLMARTSGDAEGAMKDLGAKLEAARSALAGSSKPAADIRKARAGVDKAERIIQFLAAAHPQHNIFLAASLLREADAALTASGQLLGAELADITSQPLISGSYCATQCHQQIGVKVPPETVRAPKNAGVPEISGKSMPHKAHTEMMGCVKCHEIGGHRRTPLRADYKETCRQCHN